MQPVLLIPAYNPEEKLIPLLDELPENVFEAVLVVNDGSLQDRDAIFENLRSNPCVTLLTHEQNKGKGAALKTGFDYVIKHFPDCSGVVTADADGQHTAEDILSVAKKLVPGEKTVVIGSRSFDTEVPLRSQLGNRMTRWIMRHMFKIALTDTQSGLRAIPFGLLKKLITIPYNRYEFEIEMLMVARRCQYRFEEVSVATIYEDNNAVSSFNPVVDSAKIYFVLFRYLLTSLATAAVDYVVFFSSYLVFPKILFCIYLARLVALFINFIMLKRFVFHSQEKITIIGFKYLALVIVCGYFSSVMIDYFKTTFDLNIVLSKVIAESLLYFGIFVVQKEFVFRHKDD